LAVPEINLIASTFAAPAMARAPCLAAFWDLGADGVVASLLLFQFFLLVCPMSVVCDPVVCRACLTVAASMGTGRAAR
jgi:hypothetical protein